MSRLFLGVDTSAYTTSICCICEEGIVFERRTMLSVPLGSRGLRQSEALFQHVKNLPALTNELFREIEGKRVCAVAVSASPTADEGSYMPVFLAGKLAACSISDALGVPLYETTHQAGHVRAAMFGNEERLPKDGSFLAMHISGGTTDLLLVEAERGSIGRIEKQGGSSDLHAGQFVDRVGVKTGLSFPSGPGLEKLAEKAVKRDVRLPSSVKDLNCSFSGQESAAQRLLQQGAPKEEVAYGANVLKNAFARDGEIRLRNRAFVGRCFKQCSVRKAADRTHGKKAAVRRMRIICGQCGGRGAVGRRYI
jgi:N6-L-threonylcarbamoyladenine synthase